MVKLKDMGNNSTFHVIKTLLPIPLFFAIVRFAQPLVYSLEIVAPMDKFAKQPKFGGEFGTLFLLIFFGLLATGLAFSVSETLKINGKTKILVLGIIFFFVPFQFMFAMAAQVAIFGKG